MRISNIFPVLVGRLYAVGSTPGLQRAPALLMVDLDPSSVLLALILIFKLIQVKWL